MKNNKIDKAQSSWPLGETERVQSVEPPTLLPAMYGNFGVFQKCRGGVVIAVGQFKDVAVDRMATSIKDGVEREKGVSVGHELDVFSYALILRVESGLRFARIFTAAEHQEERKSGGSGFH